MKTKSLIWSSLRWAKSLGGKFVLLVAGVTSLTMAVIGVSNYLTQSANEIELLQTKGESLGKFMAAVSAEPILAYDYVTLNDYVQDISREKDIVYILITNPEGHGLTSFLNQDNEFVSRATLGNREHIELGTVEHLRNDPGILDVETDVMFNGKVLGKVLVGMDRSQAEVMAREALIRQFISNLILLLMLVASIYVVFRHYTLQPIHQLIQGAKRVAKGNLESEVLIQSRDEMGKLAKAFNMMMRNLKSSIQEKDQAYLQLKDLNKTLEQRVDERTHALEELNQELKHLALHDPLTGMPNRVLVQDRLEQSILEAHRNQGSFAVFMIDLDRFKEVNDTLGHDAGDQLLLQVSQRLVDVLRDVDTVGRLGGDEFAIIVNDVNVDSSIIVASKILQAFERPFQLERMSLSTSASIGVAIYPEHGETTQGLLKSADVAMYVAKQRKEDFCIYHPSKDFHSEQRLSLVGELREALSGDQLRLFYQPKIDLRKQRVVGVEALVRWQHPEKGMVNPDDFIPLAEQTGLIKPLTQWVVERALVDLQSWLAMGLELSVAVNLSTQNLQDAQFCSFLGEALEKYDIPRGRLVLEVTETALMHNTEAAIEMLEDLRKLGVLLSIDDFGVGYSSFSYLKRLPVDDIKIDKSFVMDIGRDLDDALIVKSIISLAHHLGLQVVAEGVENITIMKQLVEWDCDQVQGYYISRPMPEYELLHFLDKLEIPMTFPVRAVI